MSTAVSTTENGDRELVMALAHLLFLMGRATRVSGAKENITDTASTRPKKGQNMTETGHKESMTVLERLLGLMEANIKVNGEIVGKMGKASLLEKTEQYMKVSGWRESTVGVESCKRQTAKYFLETLRTENSLADSYVSTSQSISNNKSLYQKQI